MFCFTQNSIQKLKLQEIAASFSSFKNPPNFEIPSIRKILYKFFKSTLSEKIDERSPHWQRHLDYEINQLNLLLDQVRSASTYSILKTQYSDKNFIDLFYQLSDSEYRFSGWKYKYSVWTKELLFCWKIYLCQLTEFKGAVYIFGHQLFIFTEIEEMISKQEMSLFKRLNEKDSFFIDAAVFRVIYYPEKGYQYLEADNLLEKILHDLEIMKNGLPSALPRLKNFNSSIVKRNYYRIYDLLMTSIKKIKYLDQADRAFLKISSKISYFFNKSYLLTTKNKCSISIVKQS